MEEIFQEQGSCQLHNMKYTTYQINSEFDFQNIISSLDELQIPYSFRKYTDTSFPVLAQGKPFADIIIPSEYEAEVENQIRELTNTEPQKINLRKPGKSTNRYKAGSVLLIIYSIVMTALFVYYWYLHIRSAEDKNFTFGWSWNAKDLITKSKKNGSIVSVHRDENRDMNFEEYLFYSEDGSIISESKDVNEDGFFEETTLYNSQKKITGKQFDLNNDGIHEDVRFVLDNKDTLKLLYMNNNGFYEIVK